MTSFLASHPGGPAIIRGYLGRDVTRPFSLVSAHHSPAVVRMLESFLIGSLEDLDEDPSQPHTPARHVTSLLLEDFLRVYGLLDIQYDHEAPEGQRVLFRMQAFIHFVREHLAQCFELIQRLDPTGPQRPPWMGSWSPGAPT